MSIMPVLKTFLKHDLLIANYYIRCLKIKNRGYYIPDQNRYLMSAGRKPCR